MKLLIFSVILLCSLGMGCAEIPITINYDHISINETCIIANTEQEITIPIYNGENLIGISLYPKDPSLAAVFGDNPVNGDKIYKYINSLLAYKSATYWNGWLGSVDYIEPIQPNIGYRYIRSGGNCNITVNGTYLPKDLNCSMYTYFNYKTYVGTDIIRPKRCVYDD